MDRQNVSRMLSYGIANIVTAVTGHDDSFCGVNIFIVLNVFCLFFVFRYPRYMKCRLTNPKGWKFNR